MQAHQQRISVALMLCSLTNFFALQDRFFGIIYIDLFSYCQSSVKQCLLQAQIDDVASIRFPTLAMMFSVKTIALV